MLSTKQLGYFDALARLGHFRRAADHCCVTQPALSRQVKVAFGRFYSIYGKTSVNLTFNW
jgi:DNA-binding transcriptional LysR family regulator